MLDSPFQRSNRINENMNLLAGLLSVALLLCSVAADGNETCKTIPSNIHFHEREITHFWRVTHFVNNPGQPFPNGTKCATMNIRKSDSGVLVDFKQTVNEQINNATAALNRTDTPGIYEVSSPMNLKIVFYLHHGYVLLYVCEEMTNGPMTSVFILSRRHTTPNAVLGHFKHFLDKYGVHFGYFPKLDQDCH